MAAPFRTLTAVAVITVTVRDGQGGHDSGSFAVTVGSAVAANQARLEAQTTLSPAQPRAVWLPGAPADTPARPASCATAPSPAGF